MEKNTGAKVIRASTFLSADKISPSNSEGERRNVMNINRSRQNIYVTQVVERMNQIKGRDECDRLNNSGC